MFGLIRNVKVIKIKALSDEANKFDSYIRKEDTFRSVGTLTSALRMSYDFGDVARMKKNYVSRLAKGKTKRFDLDVVKEYIDWAEKNVEPKTWISNQSAYIDRHNQLQRAIAYHNALILTNK